MTPSDLPSPAPESAAGRPSVCPECRSAEIRPSRSSYPRDKERASTAEGSFWRCANCGSRFFGPPADAPPVKRQRRSATKESRSALDRNIKLTRWFKRWVFPVLVILSTIFAVIYLLDRRDPPQEQIILPDQ